MAEINLHQLLPYGDTTQDGAVQLSLLFLLSHLQRLEKRPLNWFVVGDFLM